MRPRWPRYSRQEVGSLLTNRSGTSFSSSIRYFQHSPSQSSSSTVKVKTRAGGPA